MKKIFLAAIAATALLGACQKPGASTANLKSDVDTLSYALGLSQIPGDEEIKMYLMQAGADSAYVEQFLKGIKDGLNAGDDKKELAYQMGVQTGLQMKTRMFTSVENQVFAGDSTQHLSAKNFIIGMNDARRDRVILKDPSGIAYTAQTIQPVLMDLVGRMTEKANEKVFGPAKQKNEEFMANIAKQPGIQKLDGGVYYKVIKAGTGAIPTADQTVQVKYEGRLMDGKVFDNGQGEPQMMHCGQVIKGFSEALTHMPVGSEWEIYIPAEMGYGSQAQGPIPPYSPLIFKVQLLSIEGAPAAK